jgi:hypothetical protein
MSHDKNLIVFNLVNLIFEFTRILNLRSLAIYVLNKSNLKNTIILFSLKKNKKYRMRWPPPTGGFQQLDPLIYIYIYIYIYI